MFGCAVTTSVLGSLAALLLFLRYCAFTSVSVWAKVAYFALFILIGCLPIFAEYNFEEYVGKFYIPYRYVLYFLFITMVILFSLTVVRDAFWGIASHDSGHFPEDADRHAPHVGRRRTGQQEGVCPSAAKGGILFDGPGTLPFAASERFD